MKKNSITHQSRSQEDNLGSPSMEASDGEMNEEGKVDETEEEEKKDGEDETALETFEMEEDEEEEFKPIIAPDGKLILCYGLLNVRHMLWRQLLWGKLECYR